MNAVEREDGHQYIRHHGIHDVGFRLRCCAVRWRRWGHHHFSRIIARRRHHHPARASIRRHHPLILILILLLVLLLVLLLILILEFTFKSLLKLCIECAVRTAHAITRRHHTPFHHPPDVMHFSLVHESLCVFGIKRHSHSILRTLSFMHGILAAKLLTFSAWRARVFTLFLMILAIGLTFCRVGATARSATSTPMRGFELLALIRIFFSTTFNRTTGASTAWRPKLTVFSHWWSKTFWAAEFARVTSLCHTFLDHPLHDSLVGHSA